jgi:hypothetical protein
MPEYLVRWEIDVDVDTPAKAAREAREMQLSLTSTATVFDVEEKIELPDGRPRTRHTTVDLAEVEWCKCGNCDYECEREALDEIKNYFQRVQPGETCPAGECPRCGALSYLTGEQS